ncbi:MAG TPA: CBS domain-containing protein [Candidatus Kapabacteria bacterium]|jgi:CBS domain-containing protein|nr:CBS domain-containing protein [Candidatus Kapabacteria bacterium]HOQ49548.1 CBS domain-containing protein [Candidatus Kapabacteria bacterium]HPP39681.1 CBS domain-containing protein [Candidatus Kapabacteria bacterium]
MKVKDILSNKGPQVFTIGENMPISTAIEYLANNKIGVLLVLSDEGKICGIISERDIIREFAKSKEETLDKKVADVMTRQVIFVEPDDEIEYVEKVLTQNKIRHLPVLQDKRLVGLISIGDVVKAALSETKTENKYLMEYIGGNVK